jgi:hypothetical protein
MKQLSRLAAAASLAVGAVIAMPASATQICSACEHIGAQTYLGAHNAATADGSSFARTNMPNANFTLDDIYYFDLAPVGAAFQVTANFTPFFPSLGINPFFFEVYEASFAVGNGLTNCSAVAPGSSLAGSCGGTASLGALVGTSTAAGSNNDQFAAVLGAGTYALRIRGSVIAGAPTGNRNYQGSLITTALEIPEPASLGLVGLGLLAGAAAMRRRRQG